ncbi:hypothetical protein CRUP_033713 [Coryphaenoides rupestris]|nr:hypothetical protein CRUP_033713 [Coryphaenoides rupestris]
MVLNVLVRYFDEDMGIDPASGLKKTSSCRTMTVLLDAREGSSSKKLNGRKKKPTEFPGTMLGYWTIEKLLVFLLGLQLVTGTGHWCEHSVEERVERVLSPRLQLEVVCSKVYQYNTQGWRLDVDRMRGKHGGDDGIALYYKQQGPTASCFLYKNGEPEGVGVRGLCYSTWSCEDFPGVHNSSLMPLEQCCGSAWALSWRNASDLACLSCTYTFLPDSQLSPLVRGGLLGSARDPQGSATCLTWGGTHYRSFDRKHFHFQGSCTYLLAASTDGTWAVYISTVCDGRGDCNKGCSDAAELGHSCDIMGDAALRREAESICHRLLESPFSHCHHRVEPTAYVDTCLYLYCSLGLRERDGAVCDTLASYARECAQQHVITIWRMATLCGRVCPRGQVFSDCVSSCPPSCASPPFPGSDAAPGQCREECVGGCECPPGLYLHQGLCLGRNDCPCQWLCTGERCAAQCMLIGALQITTFDRKRYSLQGGDCTFTAVEDFVDRKLVVGMRCGECDSWVGGGRGRGGEGGLGCLREMSITALQTTVTITHTGTVTLNGQRETLPVVTADLVVRRASSSFLMVQTFGAQLLWHLEGPLALISLQPGFAHKVRGLCGTLTWNQNDDFTTPEGDIETSVMSFAAKLATEHCILPAGGPAPQDPCTTYTQRRHYAHSMCSIIHSSVFQACHDVVEREPYLRLCQAEVCGCDQQGACHCTVLTAYARHCAQEGVAIPWRNHTFCPIQCSGGKVYQECGRACGGSCSDLWQGLNCDEADDVGDGGRGGKGIVRTTQSCVPGCQCPLGLADDHMGQCVPLAMCPCVQGDRSYQPGATVQFNCNTCVCERGQLNCTSQRCEEVNQCPGSLIYSPRSCLLSCSSLDPPGRQQGTMAQPGCVEPLAGCVCPQGTVLQYVLAQETGGLFSVTAENVPCGSTGVTCTKSYSGSGLTLERVGLFVSLSSRLGVTLLWDGGMRVYVRLAAHLRGRVRGLCGNFDGDAENDFTTQQGIMESTPELFGNSWKLSPHRVPWARKRCGLLTQELFAPCHPEVPFQQYYDWCVFDACGCDSGGDCECLCTALAAYAEECNRRGVYIRWRSQELCPLQCDNGLVYEPCGPACPTSCPARDQCSESEGGALYCVEGCFCPAGTIQNALPELVSHMQLP